MGKHSESSEVREYFTKEQQRLRKAARELIKKEVLPYIIIQTYGVNVIFAPPTLFIAMMSKPELLRQADLTSLKVTIGCGAPVPVAVQEQ